MRRPFPCWLLGAALAFPIVASAKPIVGDFDFTFDLTALTGQAVGTGSVSFSTNPEPEEGPRNSTILGPDSTVVRYRGTAEVTIEGQTSVLGNRDVRFSLLDNVNPTYDAFDETYDIFNIRLRLQASDVAKPGEAPRFNYDHGVPGFGFTSLLLALRDPTATALDSLLEPETILPGAFQIRGAELATRVVSTVDGTFDQDSPRGVAVPFLSTSIAAYPQTPVSAVPEPASLALLLAGLGGLSLARRRKSAARQTRTG